ncbi:MAG: PIN domain-containing protein, partial [Candidatus Methanomethylophilus sp.]|nr:PIN domain-containing protein [Methanomethylophilus sp.]
MAIQHQIEEGKCILVASSFLLDENNAKADESVKAHIFEYIDTNMRVFVEEGEDPSLKELAVEIEKEGIKALDAAHLASAIYSGCDYFITTDDRILKYRTDKIKIIN